MEKPKKSPTSYLLVVAMLFGPLLFAKFFTPKVTAEGQWVLQESYERIADRPLSANLLVVGSTALFAGLCWAFYAKCRATRGFITDFDRPVWPILRPRLRFLFFMSAVVFVFTWMPLERAFGFRLYRALGFDSFGWVARFSHLISLGLWLVLGMSVAFATPISKLAMEARMGNLGFSSADLEKATLIGISDPELSSVNRGFVEEDLGYLWLGEKLEYRGDVQRLDLARGRIREIRRVDDKNSTASSLWAAYPIEITYTDDQGTPKRVRIFAQETILYRHRAALDTLADRLEAWHKEG